jgi:NAD(P)-dependent dehydrogenase (short-subunit alcohol dehydrogenase family)
MGSRFENRTILVVGASGGIGAAVASTLAGEGGRIVAVARRADRLEALVGRLSGSGHLALPLDATDAENVKKAMAGLPEGSRTLDGAVFCAGTHLLRPLRITLEQHYLDMFRQHVASITNFMPAFTRQAASKASVVLVSSAARFRGGSAAGAYVAAKNAVVGLARAWASELAPRIRVNSVSPGVVRSSMADQFLTSVGPKAAAEIERRHLLGLGSPEQVAGPIAFLLSDEASWITGTDLAIDGGFSVQA